MWHNLVREGERILLRGGDPILDKNQTGIGFLHQQKHNTFLYKTQKGSIYLGANFNTNLSTSIPNDSKIDKDGQMDKITDERIYV